MFFFNKPSQAEIVEVRGQVLDLLRPEVGDAKKLVEYKEKYYKEMENGFKTIVDGSFAISKSDLYEGLKEVKQNLAEFKQNVEKQRQLTVRLIHDVSEARKAVEEQIASFKGEPMTDDLEDELDDCEKRAEEYDAMLKKFRAELVEFGGAGSK